jgi:hypothetical protein
MAQKREIEAQINTKERELDNLTFSLNVDDKDALGKIDKLEKEIGNLKGKLDAKLLEIKLW